MADVPTSDAGQGEFLASTEGTPALLVVDRLLGERLYTYTLIRFAAFVFSATAYVAMLFLEFAPPPNSHFLALAILLLFFNGAVFLVARPYRDPESERRGHRSLVGMLHLMITVDFLVLTTVLGMTGGERSPLVAVFIINVTISSLLLSKKAAIRHTTFAYLLLVGLVLGEGRGWIPTSDPASIQYSLLVLLVYGLLFVVLVSIIVSMVEFLRLEEQQLRFANSKLQQLSDMRRDFLHIALHDLKSPVVASIQHLYSLKSGLGGPLSAQQQHWLERAERRMGEVSQFLCDLQTLAALDTEQVRDQSKRISLSNLLERLAEEVDDLVKAREHKLTISVPKLPILIYGVPRLLKEAIYNLVTNAVKYTPKGGFIDIKVTATAEEATISITDNGIGIDNADQARLFREFVRIKRRDVAERQSGNGLGLSIVKRIVEFHNGQIKVSSILNRGSTFSIIMPCEVITSEQESIGPIDFAAPITQCSNPKRPLS